MLGGMEAALDPHLFACELSAPIVGSQPKPEADVAYAVPRGIAKGMSC